MKLFRNQIVLTLGLVMATALLVVSVTQDASAELRHPPRPDRGSGRGPGYSQDRLTQHIGQNMRGMNTLHLRQVLNLGPQYRGRRVDFVVLNASTFRGQGQAQLLANGYQIGYPQTVGTYAQDYVFYLNGYADTLDSEIQTLQLQLQGDFYVNSVTVQLAPDHIPAPPPYPQPYPPAPQPPTRSRYECTVSTRFGVFIGQGFDLGSATADARNRCIHAVNNSRICMESSPVCRSY